MNSSLLAAAASLLLLLAWLRRRPRRALLSSTDTSAVAALNRAQLTLVAPGSRPLPQDDPPASPLPSWWLQPLPARGDRRACRQLLGRLEALMAGAPADRLVAMQWARRWGHPACLPLLRCGLRDRDPAVMAAANGAMQAFRGTALPQSSQLPAAMPPGDPRWEPGPLGLPLPANAAQAPLPGAVGPGTPQPGFARQRGIQAALPRRASRTL